MTEPNDDRSGRLRRALVKAGREERVSPALRAALVATVAAETTVVTASVAPAQAATAAAKTSVAAWKMVGGFVAAVSVGVGVAVVTASFSTSSSVSAPSPIAASALPGLASPGPGLAPLPAAVAPAAVANEPSGVSVDDLPSSSPSAQPSAHLPAHLARAVAQAKQAAIPSVEAASEPHAASADTSRLAEQMHIVESIRSAASSGRGGEALRLCEEYRVQFPNGALSEETDVLRIESLARLGRGPAAAELARRFIEERPKSPYASRVKATLSRVTEARSEP